MTAGYLFASIKEGGEIKHLCAVGSQETLCRCPAVFVDRPDGAIGKTVFSRLAIYEAPTICGHCRAAVRREHRGAE